MGGVPIGGGAPVAVQTMTKTETANLEATMEQAKAGGGDVRNGPIEIPVGKFAVLADQFGAVFAAMQPSEATLADMP